MKRYEPPRIVQDAIIRKPIGLTVTRVAGDQVDIELDIEECGPTRLTVELGRHYWVDLTLNMTSERTP